MKMIVAKDQSELDTIRSRLKSVYTSSELDALQIYEATAEYPWRTVRSKVNGARVFIEQDGKWVHPEYALPSEASATRHPDWTQEELDEEEDKYLPF